jgi:hypothetical protein
VSYNPWPIGTLPEKFRRQELILLRQAGYVYDDPREINTIFEEKLANYAGCKYAVLVDSASSGLFLSLKYKRLKELIIIPEKTYISVPMQIYHSGCTVGLSNIEWSGIYELGNTKIFDSSTRFTPDMFVGGEESLQVLSFQIKKRLPIGRGGVVLTNSLDAYNWIKLSSYDGRDLSIPYDSGNHVKSIGWHMYMTPEDAARGILLMDMLGNQQYPDTATSNSYPNLTGWLKELGLI